MRFSEFSKNLIIYDIDDTLFHTTAEIEVKKDGKTVRKLTNQEFNNYQLQPGEEFDFGEFRNAEKFAQESRPIEQMIAKLKKDLAGGNTVCMLTARADFDKQHIIADFFKSYGIDINKDVHLYRAGNIEGAASPAEKKADFVRKWLDTGKYSSVTLYDDSGNNLRVFKTLQDEYPEVKFSAVQVGPTGDTTQVEAAYPGNLGIMELVKFFQTHPELKSTYDEIKKSQGSSAALKYALKVLNVELVGEPYDNNQTDLGIAKENYYFKNAEGHILHPGDIVTHEWYPQQFFQIRKIIRTGDTYVISSLDNPLKQINVSGKLLSKIDPKKISNTRVTRRGMDENFADGEVKGKSRPGRVKRAGASCKGSTTSLKQKAKRASGERKQMYQWCANMKSGHKK
jgi:hypothetical protein